MASWQGGHGQRRSALPGPMDPVGSPRASQALPQAGRVWVQTPVCRDAAQMDAALHMLGRNHVYAKRYKQLLQSRTHPCLWVLLGDKTALPSYYEADTNPEAKSYRNFKPRFPGAWSGNPAAPARRSLHKKPRAAMQGAEGHDTPVWDGCRVTSPPRRVSSPVGHPWARPHWRGCKAEIPRPNRKVSAAPKLCRCSHSPLTCVSAVSTLILCVETNRSTSVMGWDSPSGACRTQRPGEVTAAARTPLGPCPTARRSPWAGPERCPTPTRGQAGGSHAPLPSCTLILSTASWACAMRTLVGGFLSETSWVEPRYFAPKITPSSRSSGSHGPGTEASGGTKQGLVPPPLKTGGTNSYCPLAAFLHMAKQLSTGETGSWHHWGANSDPRAASPFPRAHPGIPLSPFPSRSIPPPRSLNHPHLLSEGRAGIDRAARSLQPGSHPAWAQGRVPPPRLGPLATPHLGSEQKAVVGQDFWVLLLLEYRSNSPSLKAGQEDGGSLFCKAMREQVRPWLGSQGFSLPALRPGCPGAPEQ